MKFPKSVHAEGWASHLDSDASPGGAAPLHAAKAPPLGASRLKPSGAGAKISATEPLHATDAPRVERIDAVPPRPGAPAVVERDRAMSWMIPAGAGAAIIAAVAIWAMNRPSEAPVTPPALVVGSTEQPQAEATAATPAPEVAAAASQAEDGTTVAAAPAPAAEPAETAPPRLGPPVTTTRPAVEPRVAQAPAPRPDMVLRAAPNSPAATLAPPPAVVAAAPADVQPLGVPPGTAPIVMPPTAAGPATTDSAATPPAVVPPAVVPPVVAPPTTTPPLASATPPDANAASSAATGTPPLAQAQAQPVQPQPPAQPLPEDSGITAQVRMALAADASLAAVPIAVSTDHGVVKLEGQAPDPQTRQRATVVASSAAGVKAVDNRLTLPPPTVVGQAPGVQQ